MPAFLCCGKGGIPAREISLIEAALSWPQKTPQLNPEGKFLKAPCGNKVLSNQSLQVFLEVFIAELTVKNLPKGEEYIY